MGRATDFLKHCGLLYENIFQKSLRHFTHPSLGFKEWTESNLDVSEPKFKDRKEVGVTGKPWFKGGSQLRGRGCEALPPAREEPCRQGGGNASPVGLSSTFIGEAIPSSALLPGHLKFDEHSSEDTGLGQLCSSALEGWLSLIMVNT